MLYSISSNDGFKTKQRKKSIYLSVYYPYDGLNILLSSDNGFHDNYEVN